MADSFRQDDASGCRRAFVRFSQAWYASANPRSPDTVEEVNFGMYHPDGGTDGEMSMRWVDLGTSVAALLECFSDGFAVLSGFRDVIDAVAKEPGLAPDRFCELLLGLGFEDATPRECPYTR